MGDTRQDDWAEQVPENFGIWKLEGVHNAKSGLCSYRYLPEQGHYRDWHEMTLVSYSDREVLLGGEVSVVISAPGWSSGEISISLKASERWHSLQEGLVGLDALYKKAVKAAFSMREDAGWKPCELGKVECTFDPNEKYKFCTVCGRDTARPLTKEP